MEETLAVTLKPKEEPLDYEDDLSTELKPDVLDFDDTPNIKVSNDDPSLSEELRDTMRQDKALDFQEPSLIEMNPEILDLNRTLKCELSDEPPVAAEIGEALVQQDEAMMEFHTEWLKTEPQDDWDEAEEENYIHESPAPQVFKTELEAPHFVDLSEVPGSSTSVHLEELDPLYDPCRKPEGLSSGAKRYSRQKTKVLHGVLPVSEEIADPLTQEIPGDLKLKNNQLLADEPFQSLSSDAGTFQAVPSVEKSAQGNNSSIQLYTGNDHGEATTSSDTRTQDLDCDIYCEQCRSTLGNNADPTSPLHKHTFGPSRKCAGCLKMMSSKRDLTEQLDVYEKNHLHYQCSQCDKTFKFKKYLNVHLRRHSTLRPYLCSQCNKSFTEKSTLSRHLLSHSGERHYQCSECDKCFRHSSTLRWHMTAHTGERPYQCSQCDKSFTQSSHLNNHVRLHSGDRPFHCTQCNKSFACKSNLNRHISLHAGDRRHQCSVCDKSFKLKNALNVHMRLHAVRAKSPPSSAVP